MGVHFLDWHQTLPTSCRGGAATIGNFDGVHRGHAALVARTRQLARQVGGPALVLTFDPHPVQVLYPERFLPLLTTMADRSRLLIELGADEVGLVKTTPELLHHSAQEFFDLFLRERLGLRGLVEGADFRFGHRRTGDVTLLRSLCQAAGMELTIVEPVLQDGLPISSSRIREHLNRGELTQANCLLGRPHRLHGVVSVGARRGRTLGFPTANLQPVFNLVPAEGVYAVRVPRPDGDRAGAANIGPNPTFGENARKVEIHLIDFEGDLYGQELTVDFVARLRDTRPFHGVAELTDQLQKDIAEARKWCSPGERGHQLPEQEDASG